MGGTWRRLAAGVALAGALFVLGRPWGDLPPLGPFLGPWHGVWGVARSAARGPGGRLVIPALHDSVTVVYDGRGVPHIFARNLDDAYRAQGYVLARDRLFQMELTARATAGRLTEWAGPAALPLDRTMRRLGLAASAERDAATLGDDAPEWRAARAFAEGVTAWIQGMSAADLPFEYHLLHTEPEEWRPEYTLYLLKQMSFTLTILGEDLRRERVAALVGGRAVDALFPVHSPIQQPIVPNGVPGPRIRSVTISPPGPPDVLAGRSAGILAGLTLPAGPVAASNNWAVSPKRSAMGHALLAGDPHLDLSLPSIWYENHLVVRDTLDVYGVTFPGAPGVVIGFNRDVAWTFTSNEADAVDFFVESVDDPRHPRATKYDGDWRPVEERVEQYTDRDGSVVAVDTMYFSHRGPLIQRDGQWLSLRWTALDPSRTFRALLAADRAGNADEWLTAMEVFDGPSQNALVASREGTIAIRSTGRVPKRRDPTTPLRQGESPGSDWDGDLPVDRLPFARDPQQGFLVSANQEPVDPADDTTYIGLDWTSPWRAIRINQLLRQTPSVTVDDMRRFQTDPVSARAAFFLPYLQAAGAGAPATLGDGARRAADLLAEWGGTYAPDDNRAVLFEMIIGELTDRTWDELVPAGEQQRVATPASAILAALCTEPDNPWWDDRSTDAVEHRDDILRAAMAAGLEKTVARYGEPEAGGWRWDRVRRFDIPHLMRLPALGATGVVNSGGPSTISPMNMGGSHGASWRMVVELGPRVRGWTIYPGGQSGNPASTLFEDRIDAWSAGRLEEANVPGSAAELEDRSGTMTLVPGR